MERLPDPEAPAPRKHVGDVLLDILIVLAIVAVLFAVVGTALEKMGMIHPAHTTTDEEYCHAPD